MEAILPIASTFLIVAGRASRMRQCERHAFTTILAVRRLSFTCVEMNWIAITDADICLRLGEFILIAAHRCCSHWCATFGNFLWTRKCSGKLGSLLLFGASYFYSLLFSLLRSSNSLSIFNTKFFFKQSHRNGPITSFADIVYFKRNDSWVSVHIACVSCRAFYVITKHFAAFVFSLKSP